MQILVVVASIQMITLKTEEGKGSMTTALAHGLAGPKDLGNSYLVTAPSLLGCSLYPKGKQVNIPALSPGKSVT